MMGSGGRSAGHQLATVYKLGAIWLLVSCYSAMLQCGEEMCISHTSCVAQVRLTAVAERRKTTKIEGVNTTQPSSTQGSVVRKVSFYI